MAHTEKCIGCCYENKCDFISCRVEENRRTKREIIKEFAEKVKQMMKMPEYGFCDIERIMEIALVEMENKQLMNMEDKCVWRYEEKNEFYYKAVSPHKNLDCMIDNASKWNYCPYCGKEIEYDEIA